MRKTMPVFRLTSQRLPQIVDHRRSPRTSLPSGKRLSATMAQFKWIMIAEANDGSLDQQFATVMMP